MKKILSLIVAVGLLTSAAFAQETKSQAISNLMGLGMVDSLATEVAGLTAGAKAVIDNNTYLKWRNAAGSANLNVLKANGSDNILVNAGTGKNVSLSVADVAYLTQDATNATFTSHVNPRADNTYTSGSASAQWSTVNARALKSAATLTLQTINANNIALGTSAATQWTFGTAGSLAFATAASQIIPGATSFSIRNNANAADNFLILDSGAATLTGQFTSTGLTFPTANEEAVAGAGTTVADAAALSATKHVHQITGANGTVGWKFASAAAGQVEWLLSTTAGVPKVYAVSGGTCNGGAADAACTLLSGITVHMCYATAANAWICA